MGNVSFAICFSPRNSWASPRDFAPPIGIVRGLAALLRRPPLGWFATISRELGRCMRRIESWAPVVFLQRKCGWCGRCGACGRDRSGCGHRPRHRRKVRDTPDERRATDAETVADRLRTDGRIDEEVDLAVDQRVD